MYPHISANKAMGDAFCPGQIDDPYALDQQLILPIPHLMLPNLQQIADVEATLHPLCCLEWDGGELDRACPARSGCWLA